MRHLVVTSATVAVALLSCAYAASAQQEKQQPGGPGASTPQGQQSAPQTGGGQKSEADRQKGGKAGERQGQSGPPDKGGNAQAQKEGQSPANRQTQDRGKQETGKAAPDGNRQAQDKTDRSDQGNGRVDRDSKKETQDKTRTERDTKKEAQDKSRTDRDAKKEAQDKGRTDRDANKQAQDKGRTDRDAKKGEGSEKNAAGENAQSSGQKQATDGQATRGRAELTTDQRTRVGQTLRQQKVEHLSKVNFSINVGTRVPRSTRLYTLPASVISIVPAYRAFRYVVVDDRICIIEPSTYEIVYVIDDGGAGGTYREPTVRSAGLELSLTHRQLILRNVSHERADDSFRFRLALGAEVPAAVALHTFAEPVISEVPDIRRYRYVVVERDVLVVDPENRNIVAVIDR